jgi:succinate dehydrogenase / fumarate reductase iron-sulfur subunit
MIEKRSVHFSIFRFDPEKDGKYHYDEFDVDTLPGEVVLSALLDIQRTTDPSLSFRHSCRMAVCGSCGMVINGQQKLACKTQISSLSGSEVVVEPLSSMPVVKDLVVDMDKFFDNMRKVKPYLIRYSQDPAKELLQSSENRRRIDNLVDCISCGVCTTACPVFWTNHSYLGPAALVKAFRFLSDSRDEGYDEHIEHVVLDNGALTCKDAYQCTVTCPKGINPQEAIEGLRAMMIQKRVWERIHQEHAVQISVTTD